MKKIILTIILSSFLSAIAVAGDHVMRNDSPNASVMEGKHMMNKNPNASIMEGRHMMNTTSSRSSSKNDAKAAKTNKKTNRGYTVIKYQE